MEILLVRHGEASAEWGQHADPGLSDRGRVQAEDTARALAPGLAPSWRIVSSPMLRARETAEALATIREMPVEVVDVFREIPAPVETARRKAWLRQFMKEEWPDQSPELLAWRSDILDALRSTTGPVVIFTHFLVINAVVGAVMGRNETLQFWPDNASVTRIKLDAGGLTLQELGREMPTVVN